MGNCATVHSSNESNGRSSKRFSRDRSRTNLDVGLGATHEPIRLLGRGSCGETWLFRKIATQELVAIKLIPRPIPRPSAQSLLREITIQAQLAHGCVHIVDAYEVILTPTHLAIVMEYVAGCTLTNYVSERCNLAQQSGLFLSEDEARFIFKQFMVAVDYCHEHCVAHRDLKLDNTLLDSHTPPHVKLCDFGFAKTWTEDDNMYTHLGTPVYMAPELVNSSNRKLGYRGRSVDVWAGGILLCVMLLGIFPFDAQENRDVNTKEAQMEIWVQQVTRKWNEQPLLAKAVMKLSKECQDLLNRIFVVDEKKRISMEEIRKHPWFLQPLSPKYQEAWDALEREQAAVTGRYKAAKISRDLLKRRNKQVEELINRAAAGSSFSKNSDVVRVSLQMESVVGSGAEALTAVSE